ncbi:Kinesin heavy chain [Coccomyxa sp. Obi]|nr:Kinesin heavy chain [Coccomyxa sp. Obi]
MTTATNGEEILLEGNTSGSVRVLVRIRPLAAQERSKTCIACTSATTLQHTAADGNNLGFTFDGVHGASADQAETFQEVQDIVCSVLRGQNGCIMAYGQTGSGKTHTLIGDISSGQQKGLLARAVNEIAVGVADCVDDCYFSVNLSVVEIYCERIRDLLSSDAGSDNLVVQQDRQRGVYIAGATQVPVQTESELVALMQQGIAKRTVARTGMNAASSRSHCLVMLAVEKHWPDGTINYGKLCLVDLAGSERQDRTGAEGVTFEEGKLINKSLSALGNVVNALTDGRSAHVPYRDSKLTRALADCLGGNSRTALIICCSPSTDNATETLSSLRFGVRAKGIVNTLQAPSVKRAAAEELGRLLAEAQRECAELRSQLAALMEEHNAGDKQVVSSGVTDPRQAEGVALTKPACAAMAQSSKVGVVRILGFLQVIVLLLLVLTEIVL